MPETLIDTTKGSQDILAQLQADFDRTNADAAAAATATTTGAATDGATATQDEELEYTVDLGDGQKLSFVGKSEEEIQGKVEAALKEALKAKAAPAAASTTTTAAATTARAAAKRKTLSKDEEFAVVQEIRTGNLVEGLRKLIESQYGLTPERADEINQEIDEQKKYRVATSATAEFLEKHPEFVPSEHNKKMIGNYLTRMGLDPTLQTIEEAYSSLKGAGLLITEKAAATTTATTTQASGAAAGATAAATTRRAASSLFGRRGAAHASSSTNGKKVPTDAEMEKIVKEGGSQALLEHLEAINS